MYKLDIETNAILDRASLGAVDKKRVPEGALFFEGIVSDGNKNRNGYIIDSNAWFFDKNKSVKDFLKTGTVLFNHDSEKPIGRPLSMEKNEDGTITVTGYVYDDTHTNGAIGRGLILGLSTGHISHEMMFENSKGKRISENEFYSLPMEEIFSNDWTMVVTKAEIVEFSFVTTRSNRASVLVNEIATHLNKDQTEVERLFLNHNTMKHAKMKTNEDEEIVTPEAPAEDVPTDESPVETLSTEEIVEAPAESLPVEPIEVDEAPVEQNSIETLRNELATMKSAFEVLKSGLEVHFKNKLDEAIASIRTEERKNLSNIVKDNATTTDVQTFGDVKAKYSK